MSFYIGALIIRTGFIYHDIGALIISIRFWGPLYYTYNKEPPIVLIII